MQNVPRFKMRSASQSMLEVDFCFGIKDGRNDSVSISFRSYPQSSHQTTHRRPIRHALPHHAELLRNRLLHPGSYMRRGRKILLP